jgi:hypothetical protein
MNFASNLKTQGCKPSEAGFSEQGGYSEGINHESKGKEDYEW